MAELPRFLQFCRTLVHNFAMFCRFKGLGNATHLHMATHMFNLVLKRVCCSHNHQNTRNLCWFHDCHDELRVLQVSGESAPALEFFLSSKPPTQIISDWWCFTTVEKKTPYKRTNCSISSGPICWTIQSIWFSQVCCKVDQRKPEIRWAS